MKTVALIGKSGTGKSYQALNLAKGKDINYIIDDGLFIAKNKILAGKSAKRQTTMVGAVKTALYTDEDHKNEVMAAIRSQNPDCILVIGTSENMVDKIIKRLELPKKDHAIYIEQITNEKEREMAGKQRHQLGKHVIPVPTVQLKHEFSGYFMDPLKIFRRISSGKHEITEKTVVRPTYSYLGDYFISERVIVDIVGHMPNSIKGLEEILKISVISGEKGIDIHVDISVTFDNNLMKLAKQLQIKTKKEVEKMTALNVLNIHVYIRNIIQ
ncbi:MAG: Asp23/Gls24 family envelope stress response protein [Clostridia bacterium]|nr:Asp23/Gls24 family envelope stress response protein [Clostridia bacterium]